MNKQLQSYLNHHNSDKYKLRKYNLTKKAKDLIDIFLLCL